MSFDVTCRIKPYIQPFERKLAVRELKSIAGNSPKPLSNPRAEPEQFKVTSRVHPTKLARELAFWEVIQSTEPLTTTQSLREATVNVVRNGITFDELANLLPFRDSVPLPNRRCLRYGSHGLHEYRGKFFPQLVRAFINIAKVSHNGIIADPFCGSGTTAVEAILAGRRSLGLDMNPLSVFMARAKCGILRVKAGSLEKAYLDVRQTLLASNGRCSGKSRLKRLQPCDAEYLESWFDERVLNELEQIYATVDERTSGSIRDFMFLSISNILRRVSWQKEDDLRVRKEIKSADEIDPIKEFLEELGRSVRLVLALLRQNVSTNIGEFDVREGDSRKLPDVWGRWDGKVDTVITSPPYATALPYLDTDRLSLCYLGLLPRREHRQKDQSMIGNREITEKTRREHWQAFESSRCTLPASITNLISKIQSLNHNTDAGFRRRNLPVLLLKYFEDMRLVFEGMRHVLKPKAEAFVVVGNNHTVAGGKRVDITTVSLLTDLARSEGFEILEEIPMEMLVSREIFKKNAIESESILHFRNPA